MEGLLSTGPTPSSFVIIRAGVAALVFQAAKNVSLS